MQFIPSFRRPIRTAAFTLALGLLGAPALFPAAHAQEALPRQEALKYAFLIAADLGQLQGTPIRTDVDLKHPVALRDGEFGGLVLPEAKLTKEQIEKAGREVVPLGQAWFHKLTPAANGSAVGESKLRLATVRGENGEARVPQCALGVRKSEAGQLELVIFGKEKDPIATAPLKKIDGKAGTDPIEVSAERNNDGGEITLKILGAYQAVFPVAPLE